MFPKIFCLLSVIFVFAFLAGCGPVMPYATPVLQGVQTSTATPKPSATSTLALPTQHPNPTPGYRDDVKGFSLSPDGRTLVVSTTRQTIILNAEPMTVIKTLPIAYGESKFGLSGNLLYLSGRYFNLLLNTENWEVPTSYEADWNYLHYGSKVQVSPNG